MATALVNESQEEETVTVVETPATPEQATLHLVMGGRNETDRQVKWATGTVDNEHMGRKKSKCCCIYKKPKKFDESDSDESDSDCETGHCHGHVEKKHPEPTHPAPES